MSYRTFSDLNDIDAEAKVSPSSTPLHRCDGCFRESAEHIRQSIVSAVKRKDYHRAIATLNRLIALYPCSAVDYNNRGLVYLWSGKSHKALVDFNRAIALDSTLASSYNNRANCYVTQGARESAIDDYDRAIDLDPFHVRARINRAVTLRELNQYGAALDGFEEALLFRQFTGEIYAERGRTYHLRGDWNGAIADYRRALDMFQSAQAGAKQVNPSRVKQVLAWLRQLQPVSR